MSFVLPIMNVKTQSLLVLCAFPFMACGQVAVKNTPQETTEKQEMKNPYYSRTSTAKLRLSDEEWKVVLPEDVYNISRQKGTERAFTGDYWDYDGLGNYYCAACGNHLFISDAKFSSQCGWPSFYEPASENSVEYKKDLSHGMIRTEVLCGRCNGHLGHIFDDGPPPTHKRFCMNSIVLDFEPLEK